MTERDVFVTRKYTHKNVSVLVNIDFAKKTISFVEKNNHVYPVKKWIFAERGTKYRNGWLDILEAMQLATVKAMDELEKAEKEELEHIAKVMMEVEKTKGKKDV